MLFLGAILGATIGGLSSLGGSALTSAWQAKEAKKNRDFQERMSSTAYERSMKDMKKAGLNPILAYQKGGASTPGGATAQISDMSGATSSAMQASRISEELRKVRTGQKVDMAHVRQMDAQAGLLAAQTAATDQGRYLQAFTIPRKQLEHLAGTTAFQAAQVAKKHATQTGRRARSMVDDFNWKSLVPDFANPIWRK